MFFDFKKKISTADKNFLNNELLKFMFDLGPFISFTVSDKYLSSIIILVLSIKIKYI